MADNMELFRNMVEGILKYAVAVTPQKRAYIGSPRVESLKCTQTINKRVRKVYRIFLGGLCPSYLDRGRFIEEAYKVVAS